MNSLASNKLCLIFNIAPHYRESIYKLIEQTYSCDWYFGSNDTNIKTLDLSIFQRVKILPNRFVLKTQLIRRLGLAKLIEDKNYKTFLLTGETYNLSIWWFLIKSKLFYRHKKVYLWTHGWYGKESVFIKILKKIYFRLADGVFLYGNYARDLMLKEGFDKNKLFVIHNSLQYEEHLSIRETLKPTNIYRNHFSNENKNIIFIGRLTAVKHLDYVIESLAFLKKEGYDYNLIFVGDGPEKENLINVAQKKDLLPQVWFYGACYDDKVNAELIFNADLCVSPGNVGLTAIHTMTFGTPVLTHDNFPYQMPEFETIKENVTGGFFKENDVESISRAITQWFTLHEDRDVVRQNCYEEIEKSWTPQYQLGILKKHLSF